MKRPALARRVLSRARTVLELVRHLAARRRFFLLPLLLVLLCAGILLALTQGLSYVAPFVYTIF